MLHEWLDVENKKISDEIAKELIPLVSECTLDILESDYIQDMLKSPFTETARSIQIGLDPPEASTLNGLQHNLEKDQTDKKPDLIYRFPLLKKIKKIEGKNTGTIYKLDTAGHYFHKLYIKDHKCEMYQKFKKLADKFSPKQEELKTIRRSGHSYKNSKALFEAFPEIENSFYKHWKHKWVAADIKAKQNSVLRKERQIEKQQFTKAMLKKQAKEQYEIENNLIEKDEQAQEIARAVAKATLINSTVKYT
jgi:hypothetical protein